MDVSMSAIRETAGAAESLTVVRFLPDWSECVSDQIRAGSRIRIEYDSARLVLPSLAYRGAILVDSPKRPFPADARSPQ